MAVNELAVQPPKDCFFVQNGIHDGFVNFYVTLLRIQKALGKTSDQGTAVVMDGIAAASYGRMSISIWIEIDLGRKNVFMMQGVLDGKKMNCSLTKIYPTEPNLDYAAILQKLLAKTR